MVVSIKHTACCAGLCRYALEKEIRAAGESVPYSNVLFDESGNFILIPTHLGIKVGAACTIAEAAGTCAQSNPVPPSLVSLNIVFEEKVVVVVRHGSQHTGGRILPALSFTSAWVGPLVA